MTFSSRILAGGGSVHFKPINPKREKLEIAKAKTRKLVERILPVGWSISSSSELLDRVVVTDDYVDIRITGKPSNSGRIDIYFNGKKDSVVPKFNRGEAFTNMEIIGDTDFSDVVLRLLEYDKDGSITDSTAVEQVFTTGRKTYRTRKILEGFGTVYFRARLEFSHKAEQEIDITFRIYEAGVRTY